MSDNGDNGDGALADVRELSLASLGSLAGAGLLDRDGMQVSGGGVSVAAFNSSI